MPLLLFWRVEMDGEWNFDSREAPHDGSTFLIWSNKNYSIAAWSTRENAFYTPGKSGVFPKFYAWWTGELPQKPPAPPQQERREGPE